MKKVEAVLMFCMAATALILTAKLAYAQSLIVNGQVVEGVQVQDVEFSTLTNELNVITVGGETLVVSGTAPVEPTPTPDPTPPSPPVSCNGSANLVCSYNIDWTNSSNIATRTIIPAGEKILASRFTTNANPLFQVTFGFQPPAGFAFTLVDFWISKDPGDKENAIPGCSGAISIEGNLRIFLRDRPGCALETETTYYLNMQHREPSAPASTIDRKQSVFGEP